MAYVDPWAGMYKGAEMAQNAYEMSRQQDMADIAKAEEARKAAEYNYQTETRRGLGSIYDKANETTTTQQANPAYDEHFGNYTDEALGVAQGTVPKTVQDFSGGGEQGMTVPNPEYARGLGQLEKAERPAPAKSLEVTLPKYSPEDLTREAIDYTKKRGDWTALKALEGAEDITSKMDQRHLATIGNFGKAILDLKRSGMKPEAIRAIVKAEAAAMNARSLKPVIDPSVFDDMDFQANGDLITKDMGGGQILAMAYDLNGKPTMHVINTTLQQTANTKQQLADQGRERIAQGWERLNPRLQAELEASKAAGKTEGTEVIKMKDAYYNAQDANKLLDDAEAIFNKDPRQIAGTFAKVRAWIGEIDPALEVALNSGDKKEFGRLMMNNADTFKKLLGPQISNSDAELMFKLSGATASSPAEIRATFKTLRKRNDDTIRQYERRAGGLALPAPATAGYTDAPKPKSPTAGQPMTRDTIQGIVKNFSKDMKDGETKKVSFNGRRGTITKRGSKVTVNLD